VIAAGVSFLTLTGTLAARPPRNQAGRWAGIRRAA